MVYVPPAFRAPAQNHAFEHADLAAAPNASVHVVAAQVLFVHAAVVAGEQRVAVPVGVLHAAVVDVIAPAHVAADRVVVLVPAAAARVVVLGHVAVVRVVAIVLDAFDLAHGSAARY